MREYFETTTDLRGDKLLNAMVEIVGHVNERMFRGQMPKTVLCLGISSDSQNPPVCRFVTEIQAEAHCAWKDKSGNFKTQTIPLYTAVSFEKGLFQDA